MLPRDKCDFPKFVYLDQNKWVDLARAHYKRNGGERFEAALDAVRAAVHAGKILVPISGIHVMETMAPNNEDRRRRTAEFMVDVSRNTSVLPFLTVRPVEILDAVIRKLGTEPKASIRSAIIRSGLTYALGAEPEISGVPEPVREELLKELHSPQTSIRLLVDAADRAAVQAARKLDEDALPKLEEVRRRANADLTATMRHRVELADLFTKGAPRDELLESIHHLGLSAETFFGKFTQPDDYIAFFHSIPTVDVFVTLSIHRDRDLNRPIHRNDLKDMAYMAIALPYANLVVAENFWAHVARSSGLAGKYATDVLTDTAELPNWLKEHGCL